MNPEKQKVGIVYGLILIYTRLYQTVFGAKFIKLVDNRITRRAKLSRIFNRKSIKITYTSDS